MALHHTQTKKLAAAGLVGTETDGKLVITMDGVQIASGPMASAKDVIADAINTTESEDFDLDEFRETQDEAEDEAGEGGSVVKAKYREKYKEIGANDSNGDALALALREHLTIQGEKARDTRVDEAAMRALADANGVAYPTNGRNPGHTRMILGNVLRGRWNRGYEIVVGATTVQPTPEALQRKADAMARDEAKNNRQPRPTQTKEERAAKAKARRQAKAAARKAATEPTEAEQQAA